MIAEYITSFCPKIRYITSKEGIIREIRGLGRERRISSPIGQVSLPIMKNLLE